SGASIYNNTVYVSPQAGNASACALYFKDWTTGINNISLYNNIFITTGNAPLIQIPAGYSAFFAGNIYWTSGGSFSISYQGKNYSSLAAWRTATGNEVVNGSNTGFAADPLLSNTGAGGTVGFGNALTTLNAYKIRDLSSPAANAALNLSALYSIDPGSHDFWGIALAGGSSNDIGANQYISVLPVELLGFYGNGTGSEQDIFWNTTEESDTKTFELMYSVNGLDFNRLTELSPKGNNSGYRYVNDLISPGNNYYRLKIIHQTGMITYSPVVNIIYQPGTTGIAAWPNPFTRSVMVSMESATPGPAILSLYDASGRRISLRKVQLQDGDNRFSYDGMDNLPAGIYYLQIIHQDKTEHVKLLKAGG
ncbi:MAG: T9SS type A sorting domain-containing protein, partial [Bacteroidota bacterium]|nr:T9SS type A sorting domain-containing protein [Bacteroidota bacterium]